MESGSAIGHSNDESTRTCSMNQSRQPSWWDISHDFAWNHIKSEMKCDWNQMKGSLGGKAPKADRLAIYDAKQANMIAIILSSGQLNFEELEPLQRFGHSARLEFGGEFPEWNDNLEICLAKEWRLMNPGRSQTWEQDRHAILYGWNFAAEAAIEENLAPLAITRPSVAQFKLGEMVSA